MFFDGFARKTVLPALFLRPVIVMLATPWVWPGRLHFISTAIDEQAKVVVYQLSRQARTHRHLLRGHQSHLFVLTLDYGTPQIGLFCSRSEAGKRTKWSTN